ncbi:hypothetical protein AB7X06_02410 [Providencia rettgeri]
MYNIGTVTTTANSPKITGTGTRWKDNTTLISVGQVVLIENGSNLLINSIYSIESNTALTLAFPVSAKLTNAKYIILTTMIDSISDGVNKATAIAIASEVYTDILNQWMTAQGTLDVELPTGQKIKLRTVAEMDKQLDGKLDKAGGVIICRGDPFKFKRETAQFGAFIKFLDSDDTNLGYVGFGSSQNTISLSNQKAGTALSLGSDKSLKYNGTDVMLAGDYGLGAVNINLEELYGSGQNFDLPLMFNSRGTGLYAWGGTKNPPNVNKYNFLFHQRWSGNQATPPQAILGMTPEGDLFHYGKTTSESWFDKVTFYSTKNTTKDSNGNLKAASPVVKLFADNIELNEESEGVEMEHLGVGHYLIKGVVGFNADGAWGINNGFAIPQDHNGKNMVLIDYEVRPDGDIEIFVFHQQNADMPERFQNKRIKHFDEEGVPVYFENYEPCDVPESRWIDMRVEMPPNSLYNQKQAEAERLAKIEAERLAQEEAKRIAEEAESAEQEAVEQMEKQ